MIRVQNRPRQGLCDTIVLELAELLNNGKTAVGHPAEEERNLLRPAPPQWTTGNRSLETRDTVKATARAAQAIREHQEEADRQGQTKWAADTPGIEWDIPTKPDGSNDY